MEDFQTSTHLSSLTPSQPQATGGQTTYRLSPRLSPVFRHLFGDPDEPDALIYLLNALLQRPARRRITDVSSLARSYPCDDDAPALGCLATDASGQTFDVAFQIYHQLFYDAQARSHTWDLFLDQLDAARGGTKTRPSIGLHILDGWNMFRDTDRYHHVFSMRENRTRRPLTDRAELHIIEMKRFDRLIGVPCTDEEHWLKFLQRGHQMTPEQLDETLPAIRRTEQRLREVSWQVGRQARNNTSIRPGSPEAKKPRPAPEEKLQPEGLLDWLRRWLRL